MVDPPLHRRIRGQRRVGRVRRPIPGQPIGHRQVVYPGAIPQHLAGHRIQPQVEHRHAPTVGIGLHHRQPRVARRVAQAGVTLVAVAAQHGVHLGPQPVDDAEDLAPRPGACRIVPVTGSGAAFVDHRDEGLDATGRLQRRHLPVDRLGFVVEAQPGNPARHDHRRGGAQHRTDEGDPHAADLPDHRGRQHRLARHIADVGGDHREPGADKAAVRPGAGTGLARPARMAAPRDQPLELDNAPVELMVADHAQVDAEGVHHLDRRLVAEQGGGERRGADQVAGRHDDGVRHLGPQPAHQRRELRDAAGADRPAARRIGRVAQPQRQPAGLELTVEVVEGDDAQRDAGLGRGCGPTPRLRRRRPCCRRPSRPRRRPRRPRSRPGTPCRRQCTTRHQHRGSQPPAPVRHLACCVHSSARHVTPARGHRPMDWRRRYPDPAPRPNDRSGSHRRHAEPSRNAV